MAFHSRVNILGSIASTTDSDNNASTSLNHTLALGRTRFVLLIATMTDSGASAPTDMTISGITYGGNAMTFHSAQANTNGTDKSRVEIWFYSPAPNESGVKAVSVSFGGNVANASVAVLGLENVGSSTFFDCSDSLFSDNASTGIPGSTFLAAVTDRTLCIGGIALDNANTITLNNSQTTIINTTVTNGSHCILYRNTNSANPSDCDVLNSSYASSDVAAVAVAIRPIRRRNHAT